jgi:predicted MFS family arabinose efflux permease
MLIVVESWLNAAAPAHQRGRVLAAYNIVVYLAWAASQPLLTLAPASGFVLFCLVSILFSFSLVPVTLARADTPGTVLAERSGVARVLAVSPTAVVGAVALGAGMGAFWGMAPSWGAQAGLPRESLATFLGLVLVGALALQWPLGWVSDLVDRRVVLGASLLVAALAAVAFLAIDTADVAVLFGLALVLGGFAMPGYALCVAHANDQVGRDEVVAVSSALILFYGAGSAAGPFLAGLAMNFFGPVALFAFVAVCLAVAGLYAATRRVSAPAALDLEKTGYVAVPQTSHSALSMHRHGTGEPDQDRAPR